MKVMVTNSDIKNGLAAVRALGKKGIEVVAVSYNQTKIKNTAFYSKYCKSSYILPHPNVNESGFIEEITRIQDIEKCDVLLPIGYLCCVIISKNFQSLKNKIKIPIINYDTMLIASNKNKTIKFGEKIGIPVPHTIYIKNIKELNSISEKLTYPVVIKAAEESGSVEYANSIKELKEKYTYICNKYEEQIQNNNYPQIQEYIPGKTFGFFAAYDQGKVKAIFAHERLNEYPITGGPSTMARSIYDNKLNELGIKLLDNLQWNGVAMVEFKKDERDGEYKLIEINPKFWGSLDLAIESGVNFSYIVSMIAVNKHIKPVFKYEKITYRWLGPDLIHSVASRNIKKFFLIFFNRNIKNDFYLHDYKPTFLDLIFNFRELYLKIKSKKLINSN